jgi:hypothetical protein
MSEVEAYRRNNYYRFVELCAGIKNPDRYVLDTPYDELPPYAPESGVYLTHEYTDLVLFGEMTAYEAAEAFYEAVKE